MRLICAAFGVVLPIASEDVLNVLWFIHHIDHGAIRHTAKDATKPPVVILHPGQQFILIVALERWGSGGVSPVSPLYHPEHRDFRVGKVA